MNGSLLVMLAVALVFGPGIRWLQLMSRVRLPCDARAYVAANALGAACGLAAPFAGAGTLTSIGGVIAALGGLLFLGLLAASGQRSTPPAVRVGGPLLDFVAADDAGHPFDLASLRGHAVLLKFFRGHWCPYCVAELRRWEEMRPALETLGVRIVTVCADSAAAIRAGRAKHGLHATMLPDPDLAITDRYHLRNPRNFAPKPGLVIPLPIPTTVLADAAGTVRWIDQATDYMRRSDPQRVLGTIRAALAPATKAPRDTRTPVDVTPA
ncbi:MAG TPA: peroxiredoxin family protein [Candidatus Binatia bacterium]|jgi:peroxiredoxin